MTVCILDLRHSARLLVTKEPCHIWLIISRANVFHHHAVPRYLQQLQ